MIELGRQLRYPESAVKASKWLPAGLARFDQATEDLEMSDVLEWLVSCVRDDHYAFWTKFTLINDELLDTHEKLLRLVGDSGELAVDKEARQGVEDARILEERANELISELRALMEDPLFEQDWRYLRKRYADVF